MTARGHITAGDVSPIMYSAEATYGTPVTPATAWGVIGEGGSIQPTDNPHPYITYTTNSRAYDAAKYVNQQKEAGFKATFEVPDTTNAVANILNGAISAFGDSLPSRTVGIKVRSQSIRWIGCKTDTLTITADAPGAVAKFEENVIASYSDETAIIVGIPAGVHAVQWVGGVTLGGTTYYPQNIKLTIKNNLGRVLARGNDKSYSKALLEGRQEIEFEMTLWMEDLNWLLNAMDNGAPGSISFTLGTSKPRVITLSNVSYVCDGNNTALIQDKQMETVRFIAGILTHANPA